MTHSFRKLFRQITGFFLVSIFVGFLMLSTAWAAESLLGGFAKIDITPDKPVQLAGYESRTELSQGIHDSLAIRVAAFRSGDKRLVLISTDNIGFYGATCQFYRQAILHEFKLDSSELFLAAIHTHSAPRLTLEGHPNNVEYTQKLKTKFLRVIQSAFDQMLPIRFGVGVGSSPVGVNRREVMYYDTVGNWRMWLGRNPAGPTDKDVLVLKVIDSNEKVKAVLFDYATHSTAMGMKSYQISGDVHGLAEQFVENYLQNNIIVPAFAGASGDIDPWYRILPEFHTQNGWIPEAVLLGTLLGEEVVHVYRQINQYAEAGIIKTASRTLRLPGKPRGEIQIPENHPPTSFRITVARIGEVAFVGLGGEVFSVIGKAIKAASPVKHTLVITHCNGAAGYLPPKAVYHEGGYEVKSSPFAPSAAEIVVKEVVNMLHAL